MLQSNDQGAFKGEEWRIVCVDAEETSVGGDQVEKKGFIPDTRPSSLRFRMLVVKMQCLEVVLEGAKTTGQGVIWAR